jgi:hypothetical protein
LIATLTVEKIEIQFVYRSIELCVEVTISPRWSSGDFFVAQIVNFRFVAQIASFRHYISVVKVDA